jgi:hypothetical protein
MGLACSSLGTVAVAAIYIVYGAYQDYLSVQHQRQGLLRQRVAYLLWNVASMIGSENGELTFRSSDAAGGYLGDHRLRLL